MDSESERQQAEDRIAQGGRVPRLGKNRPYFSEARKTDRWSLLADLCFLPILGRLGLQRFQSLEKMRVAL
jgi:hypothetical protein